MTVSSIALGSRSDERCSSGGCKSPASTEVSYAGYILNSAGERKKRSKQHLGNPYVTEKKDKYFRRVPKYSNVYASSTGNQNSHARKENYHCIWKRVQKNDADVSNCDLEKLNLGFSLFDDRLKKSTLKKELPNDSIILSQSAHENQEKLKFPKNPRRNKCLDPLEENESQCQKGSPVNGASSNVCLKTNTQSDDVFGSATQIASAKRSINVADSRTGTSSFRARYKKRNVQYVSLKPIPNPKACSRNVEATGDVPIVVSNVDDQMVEHQFDLLSRSEKFDDLTARRQELPAVDGEGDKADKEVSPPGQNVTHEQLASKCQAPVSSSVNVRVINVGQNSENIKALPGDTQFGKLRNHNTCTLEQGYDNAATAKFFVPEAKIQTFHSLENDWRNISQAVNDAHRAQLASKAIEIGNGYPAAEFEKLLNSASPFICPSVSIRTCRACLCSQATNDPLCRHEISNISLENLWQWYEKHGSHGLEVKT
ncbi:uncharacterized protein LOC142180300 [Nicotiana tabacum]|uniref:Uncharacterized protein LOC142180300 n=6 Tax=Nicotiana tabacum TaxID=4097 RepID=A0AC58UEP2_TOBAC|nr:uncharacterized protein LOC108945464 [Nicotiana tomentosiformis]XP_018626957.1 uncharacterized protein LOC108945464 [Nicotiana tomentosiformis]XP_018626958.1 uncharacterized protein LOC108945464 [Nicotiana tomentosiformis]XP_018626959.1 uncharacterized protein LOC108945464 [Nicotiana tomentosiformis]XP_018626960.1 uncharacterized protein LOC108945464 [Nicotiana tomentosiformis]XP_018626962.1 uncharacterized protein LOC108945464 [Nicotiana tomentosiformis]